jgi:hypothetical protein
MGLALRAHRAGLTMFGTPFSDGKTSRLLRRQILKTFALRRDLNHPHSPACPTSAALAFAAEGGDSTSSLPKAVAISYQASRVLPKRQRVIAFEQAKPDGTRTVTIKIFCLYQCFSFPAFQTVPVLQMDSNNQLKTPGFDPYGHDNSR